MMKDKCPLTDAVLPLEFKLGLKHFFPLNLSHKFLAHGSTAAFEYKLDAHAFALLLNHLSPALNITPTMARRSQVSDEILVNILENLWSQDILSLFKVSCTSARLYRIGNELLYCHVCLDPNQAVQTIEVFPRQPLRSLAQLDKSIRRYLRR
jgi:hypothetical protein